MQENKTTVNWEEYPAGMALRICIEGHLSEVIATDAVRKWREEFEQKVETGTKTTVICNCSAMTGYDTNARKLWQKTIGDLKYKMDNLWIITDNIVFKTAAKTMGLLTSFKIKTASSENSIL